MTPIPTPEALYRRLRPEPDRALDGSVADAWCDWEIELAELLTLASDPRTEIAAAFMLLGMMQTEIAMLDVELTFEPSCPEAHPAVSIRWHPSGDSGGDWHGRVASGPTPSAALYAAMGAAIDLRRESHG